MVSGLPDFSKYVVLKSSEVTLDVDVVGSVTLDVNVVGSVVLDVNIKSQAVTLNVNIESQSVTLDVKITGSDVTLNVNVTNATIKVDIGSPLDASGNVKTAIVDSVQIDVNIAASSVTLDVNIKSQAVTLDVNIKAQDVTLNVNVQGTASVSIDNATVYLNVKQDFKLGSGYVFSTFDFAEGDVDLDIYTYKWGIFLPRGCRAWIYRITSRFKNVSGVDRTVTFAVSIAPNYPPLYKKEITIPASQTDYAANTWYIQMHWQYESMYVTFKANGDGVYMLGQSNNAGKGGFRDDLTHGNLPFATISFLVKPEGDIPVSGTVNTIQIPNKSSSSSSEETTVPAGTRVTLMNVEGTGVVTWIFLWSNLNGMQFEIEVDGEKLTWLGYDHLSPADLEYFYGAAPHEGIGVNLVRYDDTNLMYTIVITVPIEFKRSFKIYAYNPHTSDHSVRHSALYNLIS